MLGVRTIGIAALSSVLAAFALSAGAHSQEERTLAIPQFQFNGPARVIGAEAIEVAGGRFDLFGIRVPNDAAHACVDADGRSQSVRKHVMKHLAKLVGDRPLLCVAIYPEATQAECTFGPTEFGVSVAPTMIWHGWALEDLPVRRINQEDLHGSLRRVCADIEAQARKGAAGHVGAHVHAGSAPARRAQGPKYRHRAPMRRHVGVDVGFPPYPDESALPGPCRGGGLKPSCSTDLHWARTSALVVAG